MSMKSVSTPERFFTCSKTNFATFSLARPCRTVPRITGIKSGRVFMADILPPIRLPASSKQCAGAFQARPRRGRKLQAPSGMFPGRRVSRKGAKAQRRQLFHLGFLGVFAPLRETLNSNCPHYAGRKTY